MMISSLSCWKPNLDEVQKVTEFPLYPAPAILQESKMLLTFRFSHSYSQSSFSFSFILMKLYKQSGTPALGRNRLIFFVWSNTKRATFSSPFDSSEIAGSFVDIAAQCFIKSWWHLCSGGAFWRISRQTEALLPLEEKRAIYSSVHQRHTERTYTITCMNFYSLKFISFNYNFSVTVDQSVLKWS